MRRGALRAWSGVEFVQPRYSKGEASKGETSRYSKGEINKQMLSMTTSASKPNHPGSTLARHMGYSTRLSSKSMNKEACVHGESPWKLVVPTTLEPRSPCTARKSWSC
eukprot:1150812-Pelagomonas_calceolata.AAC.6